MNESNDLHDYFVFTTYEVVRDDELTPDKKNELVERGGKCVAVVFNCKDYNDFQNKYFKNK